MTLTLRDLRFEVDMIFTILAWAFIFLELLLVFNRPNTYRSIYKQEVKPNNTEIIILSGLMRFLFYLLAVTHLANTYSWGW